MSRVAQFIADVLAEAAHCLRCIARRSNLSESNTERTLAYIGQEVPVIQKHGVCARCGNETFVYRLATIAGATEPPPAA
jgi:hypothetical protein